MQILILAAGLGRRLDPITRHTPKCLVEVKGTPIIVNTLNIVSEYSPDRIVIVIGYKGNLIRNRLGNSFKGIPVKYVENEIYDKTNNVYSLWLAREFLDIDTVLIEGDVYFEDKTVRDLFSGRNENTALIDEAPQHANGTLTEISDKNEIIRIISTADQGSDFSVGGKYKTVNIYTFKKNILKNTLVPALDEHISENGREAYYEQILGSLISEGLLEMKALLVSNSRWVEIDDLKDLEQAEKLFGNTDQLFSKVDRSFGGFWKYEFVDFCYLYNVYFPPRTMLKKIKANLESLIGSYPPGHREIADKLSLWTQTSPDYLVAGNGACELISIIKKNFLKRMTVTVPAFNEYHDKLENDKVNYYYHDTENFKIDPDSFVESVRESGSNIAVLINPDLPSGQLLERNDLKHILEKLKHLEMLIIDESFIAFSSLHEENSMLSEIEKYDNLVIIRSLSKDLGVPGLRLGYAASANRDLIKRLRDNIPIWNINGIAEYFIELLPEYRAEYRKSCEKIISDRNYFYNELSGINGISVFNSKGNYILVKLEGSCRSDILKKHLFVNHKILIKDCSNKIGLENGRYIRLSVRKKEEIDSFIPKFKDSIGKI